MMKPLRSIASSVDRSVKRQTMKRLHSVAASVDRRVSQLQEVARGRDAWRAAGHGVRKAGRGLATEQQPCPMILMPDDLRRSWCNNKK